LSDLPTFPVLALYAEVPHVEDWESVHFAVHLYVAAPHHLSLGALAVALHRFMAGAVPCLRHLSYVIGPHGAVATLHFTDDFWPMHRRVAHQALKNPGRYLHNLGPFESCPEHDIAIRSDWSIEYCFHATS
jgi:hypothetical protein